MERQQKYDAFSVDVKVIPEDEQQLEKNLSDLSSLTVANEQNPLPVVSAAKSGCGRCG